MVVDTDVFSLLFHDLVELQRHRDRITSEPLSPIAISRSGTATNRVDTVFSPEGLLQAW